MSHLEDVRKENKRWKAFVRKQRDEPPSNMKHSDSKKRHGIKDRFSWKVEYTYEPDDNIDK
jgi:hypothetical protein